MRQRQFSGVTLAAWVFLATLIRNLDRYSPLKLPRTLSVLEWQEVR